MRLLHFKTINIICNKPDEDFKNATVSKKQIISHAWSEVFKGFATMKEGEINHPKMFMTSRDDYANYLYYIYDRGIEIGCKLDYSKLKQLSRDCKRTDSWMLHFDDLYLFSDACSLYYKGVNIFPEIYGDRWRTLVPVESLKEIKRQVDKTTDKRTVLSGGKNET
jgi:hypothetical protein